MTRFSIIIFSCLTCTFPAYSTFLQPLDEQDRSYSFSSDEDDDIFGGGDSENSTISLKKDPAYQLTSQMSRRITGLSSTYDLNKKEALLLHWCNKALSRGNKKRATSIEQFFHASEISKMVRQGINLEKLLLKIKIVKSVCNSPLKPIQGNFKKKRKFSPYSLVFSPAKRAFIGNRRNSSPTITTQGRDRLHLKPLKLNFSFGESLLDALPEVPKGNKLKSPRTRNLQKKEFTKYLNGSSDLQEYEKLLWNPHQKFILKTKKKYYNKQGPYPTIFLVQQTFLKHVAPHMTHLKVLGYDVYFDLKILCGRNSKEKKHNLDLLDNGLAPLGPDGKPMDIHHLTQRGPGEAKGSRIILAFVSNTLHGESELNSFQDRQSLHFSKKRLFGSPFYVSIDRTLFAQHRLAILKSVYGKLNT